MIWRGLFLCGLARQPHCPCSDANIQTWSTHWCCEVGISVVSSRVGQFSWKPNSFHFHPSLPHSREQHHGTTGSPSSHSQNLIATATILGTGSKAHSLPFLFETGPQRPNLQSKFAVMGFHLPVPDRRCLCEVPWFTFQEDDLFFFLNSISVLECGLWQMFRRRTTGLTNRLIFNHTSPLLGHGPKFLTPYLNLHQPQIWLCSQNLTFSYYFQLLPATVLPTVKLFLKGIIFSWIQLQDWPAFSISNAHFHSKLSPHFLKRHYLYTHYGVFLLLNSSSVQGEEERTLQPQLIPGTCMEECRGREAFGWCEVFVPQVV